ncbi:MAG: hypothetical protein IPO24_04890 [Bacteroidetes bacterium]|nr:hypothetical protein [Bacteroidota bacterium]
MKKPVIILLHVGYWLVFLLLLFVLYGLSSAAALNNEQDPGVGAGEWFKLMFSTTILPGVICFYTFYFTIFSRFLQKRRIPRIFYQCFCCFLCCSNYWWRSWFFELFFRAFLFTG